MAGMNRNVCPCQLSGRLSLSFKKPEGAAMHLKFLVTLFSDVESLGIGTIISKSN